MATARKRLPFGTPVAELTFELDEPTKRTYRYRETSTVPVVGTLYVQKSTFEGDAPTTLTVTISVPA